MYLLYHPRQHLLADRPRQGRHPDLRPTPTQRPDEEGERHRPRRPARLRSPGSNRTARRSSVPSTPPFSVTGAILGRHRQPGDRARQPRRDGRERPVHQRDVPGPLGHLRGVGHRPRWRHPIPEGDQGRSVHGRREGLELQHRRHQVARPDAGSRPPKGPAPTRHPAIRWPSRCTSRPRTGGWPRVHAEHLMYGWCECPRARRLRHLDPRYKAARQSAATKGTTWSDLGGRWAPPLTYGDEVWDLAQRLTTEA